MISILEPIKGELINKKFNILDKGYIMLADCMGADSDICEAARVSYGIGTKSVSDDRTLIRYLLRHWHTTPFEMCELKFLVKVPMDTWRQWIRHRTANVNEYSTRYSEAIDDKQETKEGEWRLQSGTNKQGSSGYLDAYSGKTLSFQEKDFHSAASELYMQRLQAGVAREQARKDLPLSTYTMAYWKIDLHNLLHFLRLRMDSHAQLEIRSYANIIGKEIVARLFPFVWEAFVDYQLEAVTLTRLEIEAIYKMLSPNLSYPAEVISDNKREQTEFEDKLAKLGL